MRNALLLLLALVTACSSDTPEPVDTITPKLEAMAERAKPGTLGLLMLDIATHEARGVNMDKPLPMQSLFKLPLGIVVMDAVDKRRLSLDEKVTLRREQLSVPHSPIAEAFPQRTDYTLGELLHAAIAQSDNTAADLLMRRIGGPQAVTRFFRAWGIANFRVDRYESELQPQAVGLPAFSGSLIGLQAFKAAQAKIPLAQQQAALRRYLADPRDRMSPMEAIKILALLSKGRMLKPESNALIMEILRSTTTGADRLKAGTPASAAIFHKTGTGPTVGIVNTQTSDIGIIEMPGGRRLAIAVILAGTELPSAERDAIIAEAARLATTDLVKAGR